MNSRVLEYVIRLGESGSFSQVAEQCGVSQPALSKAVLALENELGVKLFDRSRSPVTVTAAGEQFIREAEEILFREDRLKKSMAAFQSGEAGQLVIGITSFRAQYRIGPVLAKFSERYPEVRVVLREASSSVLRAEAAEGRFDLALLNLPIDESALIAEPLEEDRLVLMVPERYAAALPDRPLTMADCAELPFITVGKSQEMRVLLEQLCAAEGIVPRIAAEVYSVTTARVLAFAGVGATLMTLQAIAEGECAGRVRLFELASNPYVRRPALVTKRGQYLSEYAKYAMELLRTPIPAEPGDTAL